jgi:hypothetical protein
MISTLVRPISPRTLFRARPKRRIDVASRAAKAEHRILLDGFERPAAQQVRVFVRLEIGQAHDDRMGCERRRNLRHALAELVDEEGRGIGVAGGLREHAFSRIAVELVELE